jgi:FMN phosphatase YigB (HAD superfamily)
VIRTIVFDVGWVFVHLNPKPILDCLAEHDCDIRDLHSLVRRIGLNDHETGRLTGRGLMEQVAALGRRPMHIDLAHAGWLQMFELQPRMVDLAHRLGDKYRVHLLSNVGDLHWAHLCREYGLHRIGHGALPSFVTGYMKPDAEIYAEAERRFGLDPKTTVFIDDRAENLKAARKRGWQGIEHSDFHTTAKALRVLGVNADVNLEIAA